jgi:hypothetical protein
MDISNTERGIRQMASAKKHKIRSQRSNEAKETNKQHGFNVILLHNRKVNR